GQNRDPWGSGKNNGGNSGGNNKGGRDQGPPDLDDVFRKLSKKLSSLGVSKRSNSNSGGTDTSDPGYSGRIICIAAVAVV
ncbi:MAG: protease modulator HflK N-terminal domain-containing protein, partial [Serratia symbiotica]|nr:protease modulator HflK N-terminal domain-containing protein [Serratia symbiotica]